MSRKHLISGPLGALALGGLLVLGAAAGQAKGDGEGQSGDYALGPDLDPNDGYADGEPYPWPDFVGVQPVPGRYRTKITVVDIELPEMPEIDGVDVGIEEMMRSSLASTQLYCVGPDFQSPGDWLGGRTDESCTEPEISLEGSTFSYRTTCTEPDGGRVELHVTGTVAPDRSRMQFDVTASQADFGQMRMRLRSSTDRVGDCD